ncbi:MAG: hypothetical protein IPG04_07860 [Polyangiaceae bacterium]|nr:hypothetical protein [Polyangiaceae bacterium]
MPGGVDPSRTRPSLSILPPLPMSRGSSWASAGLLVLFAVVAVFVVVRLRAAPERLSRPSDDLSTGVGAIGRGDTLPWFPVKAGRAAATSDEVPAADESRADARLKRAGRSHLARGVFFLPPTFSSPDGEYDLVLFFHGNTDLVEEGLVLSGINAAAVIFNLGNGSGVYDEKLHDPSKLPDLLARAQAVLSDRGLRDPKLRRLAIVSWSAGYGATQAILSQPKLAERVDSVVILDGMHAGFLGDGPELAPSSLDPFIAFAERAKKGEKLFVLTHSNIEPVGYASVARSADHLLSAVGVSRVPEAGETFIPAYVSLDGVLPRDQIVALEPRTAARAGSLIVKGYGGNQANHHVAHLIQMPDIALGHLVARWLPPQP